MRKLSIVSVLFVLSCGDPLVDESYRGDALFRLEGQIRSVNLLPPEATNATIRAGLFWNPVTTIGAPIQLIEQASVSTEIRFPSTFVMTFFLPPEQQHMANSTTPHARGLILVYADRNTNGRFDEGTDLMLGGTVELGVLYVPSAVSGTSATFAPGFHLLEFEYSLCSSDYDFTMSDDDDTPVAGGCSATNPCSAGTVCDISDGVCETEEPVELRIGGPSYLNLETCQ